MNRYLTALIGAGLTAISGSASAQPAPKTFQLSKVLLDTETQELTARVKGGTLCVFPSNVKIPKEKKTQDYERFDNLFSERMKAGGYTVVSTSNEMFASDDSVSKGDFLVGATLRPTAMNLCSSVSGEKGDVTLSAEWQIYDRAAGKVVETVSTSALGKQEKFAVDGQKEMFNSAFRENLTALLSKGVIQKYTASVEPQQTPSAAPDAATSASQQR